MPRYTGAMSTPKIPIAQHVLLVAVPQAGAENVPGRIQLFPSGEFAARDGRPGSLKNVSAIAWRLSPADAQALVERWRQRMTPVVVDYEHQTQLARENGQPSPAAGWIRDLEALPDGLFATVDWTDRARAAIRSREYQYISPVFAFDPQTGAVIELISAALTNHPALDGMMPASAKTDPDTGGTVMDKLTAVLRTLLGLPESADEAACLAALGTLPQQNLIALLKSKEDALVAAKAAAPDAGKYVEMATFRAVQDEAAQLRAKLVEMQASAATAELSAAIDDALKDGRLAASAKNWALDMAKTNPDALRGFLAAATPIPALAGTQTEKNGQPGGTPSAALTAEEGYVCAQLGISAEDYKKNKGDK